MLGSGKEAREWGMGKRKDRIVWQAWGNTGREVALVGEEEQGGGCVLVKQVQRLWC